jgi:hypothetical protein
MKTGLAALQCGQVMRSEGEGVIARSRSHDRHLKCIIGVMKPLLTILLIAVSVQAQSLADAARKERERQANLKPAITIKQAETITSAGAPSAETAKPKEPEKVKPVPAADPVEAWNAKVEQLRAKIRDLQDQETALQLQQTQLQNQVYAPVVDPAVKDQAQAELNNTLQQLAKVREDMDGSKKDLDAMQAEGPPKK